MGNVIRRIVFVIALLVFIGSAGYLLMHFLQGQAAERDFESLKVDGGHDLAALHEENPDIVGWIKIDGTKVDYPVMQTENDPEYYLRRNFKKEDSTAGTPFMDAESDMETSANWMIYGHNMKNGSMFHDIMQYEHENFFKEHKIIHFDTLLEGEADYEVVAACYTKIYNTDDEVFKYYYYPFVGDEATFTEYVAGVKNLASYDTGVNPVWGDQLITLSTCEYSQEDGRFIVVARKLEQPVEETTTEETP